MPAQITGLLGRVSDVVKQFSLAQRTLVLIGVAVLVLGAAALSSWLARPTMSPLFANLSATDASAIVDHLEGEGVAYELTDGGSTILVPDDALYSQRLAVAAAGLPTASEEGGYSLLKEMPMTSSEFQQQITYQRALEGELAKTIGSLDGVEAASVRLALPEDSVFVEEKSAPKASVFVRTAAGTELGADTVQSIVHLVSSGIPDMTPSNVSVVGADGTLLSAIGGTEGNGGLQDGRTGEHEARVRAGVQAMLDRVVGPGNAVVTVTAELDFDKVERTSETYETDPKEPATSSSTSVEEYTGAAGNGAAGVLGSDNQVTGQAGAGEYRKETETRNNPTDKFVEKSTSAPGAVSRQSVAVVLSQEASVGRDLTELEAMVAAAAGIDPERGDVVEVQAQPFSTSAAEAAKEALDAAAAEEQAAAQASLVKTGAIAGAIVLVLVVLVLLTQRRARRARREAIDIGALEIASAAAPAEVIEAPDPALALPPAQPVLDEAAARREDVLALAAEQPAEVAEALRGWLAGSRR